MLAHSRRRLSPFLRQYATRTAVSAPKNAKKTQPAPKEPIPQARSLKARLLKAQQVAAAAAPGRVAAKRSETELEAEIARRDDIDFEDVENNPHLTQEEREALHLKQWLKHREDLKAQGFTPPPLILPLMDLAIPYAVSFKARSEYPSVQAMYRQFVANRINDGKNAFSMRHIGISDSFPGVEIDQSLGWFRSAYLFAKRVFGAQSLRANAWVAPMRQEVLEQYIKLNKALMQRSPKLTDLTMESFSEEVLALLRKRDPEHLYRWNFHREVTPTRILSLRAADGEFSKEMPETGTRVGVQALVRFDTEQSIEIYDKSGKALHTPAPTAEPQPPRLGSKTLHVVPAQRQRVTEYLVLDKPMYIPNSQWMFRARFVPTPGRTVAV